MIGSDRIRTEALDSCFNRGCPPRPLRRQTLLIAECADRHVDEMQLALDRRRYVEGICVAHPKRAVEFVDAAGKRHPQGQECLEVALEIGIRQGLRARARARTTAT